MKEFSSGEKVGNGSSKRNGKNRFFIIFLVSESEVEQEEGEDDMEGGLISPASLRSLEMVIGPGT